MGIINNDSIDTPYGTSVVGAYIAIADNSININRDTILPVEGEDPTVSFNMYTSAGAWLDKAARDAGKSCINIININCDNMTPTQLAEGPYVCAYNKLKVMYPNHTDD